MASPRRDDLTRFTPLHFAKTAFAGGLACALPHTALYVADSTNTTARVRHNLSRARVFRAVVREGGAAALAAGAGASAATYFVRGACTLGGVELGLVGAARYLGAEAAADRRLSVLIVSAAAAELVANVAVFPQEVVRLRALRDATWPRSLPVGAARLVSTEGVLSLWRGLGRVLLRQMPFAAAKFAMQDTAARRGYTSFGTHSSDAGVGVRFVVGLGSGLEAGMAAAVISQPLEALLTKVNRTDVRGFANTASLMWVIAKDAGFVRLVWPGLLPRCAIIGMLTAGQFGLFEVLTGMLGARRFSLRDN